MYLSRLELSDFRSYPSLAVELPPGVSLFLGLNGRGKTNLVEAVGYLATLASHRTGTDAPLVRAGCDSALVRAVVEHDGRPVQVEVLITPGKANRARVNRGPVSRPREILGLVRTVLFAPEDIALIRGDPGERRRFLDELLVLRSPRMAGVRADYDRVLRQRNALLKSAGALRRTGRGDLATLDVWDAHLARTGAELLGARLELVADLAPLVAQSYGRLAGPDATGPARVAYRSSVARDLDPDQSREHLTGVLAEELCRRRREEVERGVSLVGPHRDDLTATLGEQPARGYASHGESWSFALALRLGSYELLRSSIGPGGGPILLLDDVFAELDSSRREALARVVRQAEQVLVTAAVSADVPEQLAGARFEVGAGTVSRQP